MSYFPAGKAQTVSNIQMPKQHQHNRIYASLRERALLAVSSTPVQKHHCVCVCVFVYDLSISPCKTNFIIWHFNGWKLFPDLTCCSCWSNICSMLLNLLCLHNVLRAFLRHRTQGRKKDNKVLIYSIAIHECGHSEVVLSYYGLKTAGAFMRCCQALLVTFFTLLHG